MNKSGLVIRLAIVIAFTAIIVGLITTQLFYRFTFLNEARMLWGRVSTNRGFPLHRAGGFQFATNRAETSATSHG